MIVGNHEVHLRFRGYLGGTVNRPLGSLSVYNNSQVVGFIKRPLNIKLLLKMIMKLFVFFFLNVINLSSLQCFFFNSHQSIWP